MFIDKWKPLYAEPEEVGSDTPETETETPNLNTEPVNGPESARGTLRQQLEKNTADLKKSSEVTEKKEKAQKTRLDATRARHGADDGTSDEGDVVEDSSDAKPSTAPEAYGKDLSASWAALPPEWQAAINKREEDGKKGVEELKTKYSEIDKALAPHLNAIRQANQTPAASINQLFGWMQALSANPDLAFPALAKSFGWDWAKLTSAAAAAPQTQQTQAGEQPTAGALSPEVQKYISDMQNELKSLKESVTGEITNLKGTFQQQSEAKTQETLDSWSSGKTHFAAVRQLMANLIQTGAVPLKEGRVDLDGAYEMAIYANPEIRTLVLQEKQQAAIEARKKKAAEDALKTREQADKARRAGVSLGGGAPGEAGTDAPKGKKKSVRESIMQAREELNS